MKITTKRYLDTDKIRETCIDYNFYTRGDCEAYERMFDLAREADADKPEDMYRVAKDIYDHSNLRLDEEYTENQLVAGIMFNLYNECTYTLVEIED